MIELNVVADVNERYPPDGVSPDAEAIEMRGVLFRVNDENVVPLHISVPLSIFTTLPSSVSVPSDLIHIDVSVSVAPELIRNTHPLSRNASITVMLKRFIVVEVDTGNIDVEEAEDVTLSVTEVLVVE